MTSQAPNQTDLSLSIIIIQYRAWDLLRNCLANLPINSQWCEVIVVDHSDEPDPLASLRSQYPSVRFIANPKNPGFAAGCNMGLAHARGKFCLFLNPDTSADEKNIAALLQRANDLGEHTLLAPAQRGVRGNRQRAGDVCPQWWTLVPGMRRLMRLRATRREFSDSRMESVDWISGSAFLLAASLCKKVGGWSEDYFMYSEDVDLCRRARQENCRVGVDHAVVITHTHAGSSRINPMTASLCKAEATISRHVYAGKHLPPTQRLIYHFLLACSRLPLPALGALLYRFGFRANQVKIYADIFQRLSSYYKLWWRTGDNRSPRAPNRAPELERGSARSD